MPNDIIEDALLDARAFISKAVGGFGAVQTDGPEILLRIEEALKLREEEKNDQR